jgi:hypothetical protein
MSSPIWPGEPDGSRFLDPARPKCEGKTVIAIIDDGCPFAHQRFRFGAQQMNSRVFAIWDQNLRKSVSVSDSSGLTRTFGEPPTDLSYGIEFRRTPTTANVIGIDEWITMHQTLTGGVDEESCYREAGFESLLPRYSHGAHVMDVFAGRIPPSSRLSFDPTSPPSFALAPAPDVAGQDATDIIFVQLPRAAVDDPSGQWLATQVTDALYYILSCVDPTETDRLIVNLSYGPTTEPHNGNAILEDVMSEFTTFYDGTTHKPELSIALPSGNSRLRDWHLMIQSTQAGEKKRWTWRVPPDNPVPIFTELWVPSAQAGGVSPVLFAPFPYVGQPPVITETTAVLGSHCWVVTLPPTQAATLPPVSGTTLPGAHGDWTIELTLAVPGIEVHAYLARSDPNMGARIAAKPSRFIDAGWEISKGGFANQTLKEGVRDIAGSLVARDGTLNGIATASDLRVRVAGGYRLNDKCCSPYASVGPSRESAPRKGPDYALPTDESPALLGIRAGGNRSGAVFRLVGTSTAAPQLARWQASVAPPAICPRPSVIQKPDIGCGRLNAP